MVPEKTIGKGFCNWTDVFNKQIQEILVILLFLEDVLPVVTTIVYVVKISWNELLCFLQLISLDYLN